MDSKVGSAAAIAGALVLAAAASGGLTGTTTRVSVDSGGAQANGVTDEAAISRDGALVGFHSAATNLVAGDTNGDNDVFVHERQTGMTTRVSVATGGAQGNAPSRNPVFTPDGGLVAFVSAASNLVAGDTNNREDVFVHDRQTGVTTRVSVNSAGTQGNGDSGFRLPAFSADGTLVAFDSFASNLVSGDTNAREDVFVHDRQSGVTTRISVSSSGAQANNSSNYPEISADGRLVVFHSDASNLVAGDTNGLDDIFVHDRQTGATTRVSVSSAGAQANGHNHRPDISPDGRFVGFHATSTNLVAGDTNGAYDVFVRDLVNGLTTRVSRNNSNCQGNNDSLRPRLSTDGLLVAFDSLASNLTAPDSNGSEDVFVHDRQTGVTTRVSVSTGGTPAIGGASDRPAISGDGLYVAFASGATNLVAGDTNAVRDVFLRDRTTAGRYRPTRLRPCP